MLPCLVNGGQKIVEFYENAFDLGYLLSQEALTDAAQHQCRYELASEAVLLCTDSV